MSALAERRKRNRYPRRQWVNVPFPDGHDLRSAEDCARYLMAARDRDPETYAMAKQHVDTVRTTEGNPLVRTFTVHESNGARRFYICGV